MGPFSNRELATGVWLLAFLAAAILHGQIRKSLGGILRSLLQPPIIGWSLVLSAYIGVVITALGAAGLWEVALLKQTIMWFFLGAVVTTFRFVVEGDAENIFRRLFADNVRAVILIEFLVNTYEFSLAFELVFVPVVALITLIAVVAASDKKFGGVASIANWVVAGIGALILGISLVRAISDFSALSSLDTARSVSLAPLLSILLAPFIYVMLLITRYEEFFVRLDLGPTKDSKLRRHARLRILMYCGVNLGRVQYLLKNRSVELMRVRTRGDIDDLLRSSG